MKHIKRFNENQLNTISFEDAKKWILDNYSEDRVNELFDDEVASGDWIDREQMEEEDYESEHDYYTDYGRGEAEYAIMNSIIKDLESNFKLGFDTTGNDTDIYDFMKDEFPCL